MLDRLLRGFFLISLLFFAFAAGLLSVHDHNFLYVFFQHALEGGQAWHEKQLVIGEKTSGEGARKISYEKQETLGEPGKHGEVTVNKPGAYQGYTLYTAGLNGAIHMIDMDGNTAYRWFLPFSAAWPKPEHIESPLSDKHIFFSDVHLYPNGDIIGVYQVLGDTPYGYGIVKMDKDSHVVWKYPSGPSNFD